MPGLVLEPGLEPVPVPEPDLEAEVELVIEQGFAALEAGSDRAATELAEQELS